MPISRSASAFLVGLAAFAGALVAPVGAAQAATATAEIAGVTAGSHAVTVRDARSTTSTKVGTIKAHDSLGCVGDTSCTIKTGGSYTCWSGGPSGNTWVHVLWGDTYPAWVARECVSIGRVA
jgi:hypothetical protein